MRTPLFPLAAVSVALCAFVGRPVHAQVTWTAGSGTDLNWSTGTNWNGNVEPTLTDDVLLPAPIPGASGNLTLSTGEEARSLTINAAYTLGGGSLTLGGTGNVAVADGITATISSVLQGSGAALTKTGTGTLVLSGANTFTGPVTISGGVLSISTATSATAGSLGAATTAVTLDGGTLRYTGAARYPSDASTSNQHNFTVTANGGTFDTPAGQMEIRNAANSLAGPSGATIFKAGSGVLRIASANSTLASNFVVNGGTLEGSTATAFGSGSITVNSGSVSFGGNAANAVILAGGSMSPIGADRTLSGAVSVTGSSSIALNDWYQDVARSLILDGKISGAADSTLTVGISRSNPNTGTLTIRNSNNDFAGSLVIQKNLTVNTGSSTGSGKTLGTASVTLAGGRLFLKDNNSDSTNATLAYGNNVIVTDPAGNGTTAGVAVIDVNRVNGTVASNNTFQMGSLSIGEQTLTVQGANGYKLEFAGASQLSGNATFNTTTASLTLSGALGEDAAGRGITKTGAGSLTFTGNASYSGATVINSGAVTVGGTAGALSGTSSITLAPGTSLTIDNSASNVVGRIRDAAPITLSNASVALNSPTASATNASETVGAVTVAAGSNTIAANLGNAGAISALTLSSLTRTAGATVNFTGTSPGQTGNSSRIILANQATNVPFLGAWATVNGTDFAQYVATTDGGFVRGVAAVDSVVDPADDTAFDATTNLKLTGTTTTSLTGNRTVNSVNFAGGTTRTLALGSNNLVVASGGILSGTGTGALTSAGGTLTAGAGVGDLLVTANAPLTIGAPIVDNGAALSLTKAGTDTLTLSGASTFTGPVTVNQGTLAVSDVNDTGTAGALGAGNVVNLGSAVQAATLRFTGATDSTNKALVIGGVGGTVDVSTSGSNLTVSGGTTGGGLTKSGAGTLTLGGTSTIASATVTAGTLGIAGTATITGDLNVGVNGGTSSVVAAAGSTLSVGSGSANSINIGSRNNGVNTSTNGTLDLSAAAGFTANVGTVRIENDFGTASNGVMTGVLKLPTAASAVSSITATNAFTVGSSPTEGGNAVATLNLGGGSTTIVTPTFTVGSVKVSGLANIGAGGTFTLNNASGRTTLNVGTNNADTGTAPSSTFDLSGGTFVANLGAITVGFKTGGGAGGKVTGTLNLGTSAETNVNASVSTGQVLTVGRYDFANVGANPTTGQATATMTIGGGTVVLSSTDTGSSAVVVGYFNNSSGAITSATAANGATGTLNITGGSVTINSGGTANAINLAQRTIQSGTVGANTATATLNISGGSLTVNNAIVGNGGTANAASTSNLNISGGLLNMQGKNITNITNLSFSGGTIRNLGTLNQGLTQSGDSSMLDVSANNTTIQGTYAVTDGDVSVAASRTLNVSGGITASGSATLLVNGALSGGLTTVNAGATITGSGTTAALTIAGGTVAPGNAGLGILNTGNLTLGGGSLTLEINGTTAGTGYDQINTTGTVSLTANTNFTLSLGYTPAIGDAFTVINNDGTDAISTGAFGLAFNGGSPLAEGGRFTLSNGVEFAITYKGGTNGNDVVLTTTIPEPASVASLLGGLGMLLGVQRFRRRAK